MNEVHHRIDGDVTKQIGNASKDPGSQFPVSLLLRAVRAVHKFQKRCQFVITCQMLLCYAGTGGEQLNNRQLTSIYMQ